MLSPAALGQVGCEVCKAEHTRRKLRPAGDTVSRAWEGSAQTPVTAHSDPEDRVSGVAGRSCPQARPFPAAGKAWKS